VSLPIIEVEGLSKAYPVYYRPGDLMREVITGRRRHDQFWALRDISFAVKEKQRLGIIGQNGSGKSTLLKIITGHLRPTAGRVQVRGQVSAMLSLNTILNPEETGLSNIRFNLVLAGCPKSRLAQLTDEIIDFTELGAFIYAPVKTYSSGMNAKLAFAITTAIEPEILVIDEVLGVGDAYFVGKATQRMKALCDRGKALVFVSHSDSAVRMLCDTVLWMENGGIRMIGPSEQVLARYEEDYRRTEDENTRAQNRERSHRLADALRLDDCGEQTGRLRLIPDHDKRHLTDTHYIRRVSIRVGAGDMEEVSLATDGRESKEHPALDIFGSEWGRYSSHRGHDCRMLTPRTGRARGGHIDVPRLLDSGPTDVELTVEYIGLQPGRELLTVEYANLDAASWSPALLAENVVLPDGWLCLQSRLQLPALSGGQHLQAQQLIQEASRAPVEIESASIRVRGVESSTIPERAPFVLLVRIRAFAPVSRCDVGIKILRADGVYSFWQSSGQSGENLLDFSGQAEVLFKFPENPLGAGQYLLSAYAADGWDYPANYPYAEVFDRKVGLLSFTVSPEMPEVDFGIVNVRADVHYSKQEKR
jgi:lipopolysaccharide transport system ATP-binding protein